MLSRQLTLFRDVQSFRLLALATVGSAVGTWLAFVALTIDVYDRTESAIWVSGLLIADFLPAILIGFAAGTLVDRLPRRRLMIWSDLARFAVFAVLPFANDAAAIVALAAVAGFATGFFRPALYAGLPNLVSDDDLPHANSLLQTIENVAWALGPVAGGVLVAATGADAAAGCRVTYTAPSQWPGGFTANVAVTNLGDPINGWTLTWAFPAGQRVSQGWNANVTQSGAQVTAANAGWNAGLPTGGSVSFGFNGSWTGSNPAPAAFALNGVACTGAVG